MPGSPMNEHGLTEKQESFVRNYVFSGGIGTIAAKDAGYSASSAHCRASELLKLPKIQQRMFALTRDYMGEFAPSCVKSLAELAVSAQSESVRQAAASSVLDRLGMKTAIQLEVTDNRSQADIDTELSVLLGLSDVIEGELADTSTQNVAVLADEVGD